MKTTIDGAGRLVIPRKIRRDAGLEAGTPLEIRLEDGRIEIEAAPLVVKLVKKGRLTVAVPKESVAPLTTEDVQSVRDRLLQERSGTR